MMEKDFSVKLVILKTDNKNLISMISLNPKNKSELLTLQHTF